MMSDNQFPPDVGMRLAAFRAFDDVLNWINTQTEQIIDKKHLYAAVMEMRPKPEEIAALGYQRVPENYVVVHDRHVDIAIGLLEVPEKDRGFCWHVEAEGVLRALVLATAVKVSDGMEAIDDNTVDESIIDIVHCEDGKWYFWQECWSDRYGPFATREEAEIAFDNYCQFVLGINDGNIS